MHVQLTLSYIVALCSLSGETIRCYTCMGSNNDDCNRQGSKACPGYSDACAVVVGHDSESNSDSVVAFLFTSLIPTFHQKTPFVSLVYVRVCLFCVLNRRQPALCRHISGSRGSEAFKGMKRFATPTQWMSLIRTPCVHGTKTDLPNLSQQIFFKKNFWL